MSIRIKYQNEKIYVVLHHLMKLQIMIKLYLLLVPIIN